MDIHADNYEEFTCIGGECKRNCCQGWTIDLDPDTTAYYQSLDDEYGEYIKSHLEVADNCIGKFHLKKGEKCPAQQEDGLCEIFIRYGEDKLSRTCTNFPRYNVTVFGDNKVRFLINECEEVLRLMYDREKKIDLIIEAKDKKDLDKNVVMADFAQLVAWGCDTIQDESIPLWNALITVLHVFVEASKPFMDVEMETYDRVIKSIPAIFQSYEQAICGIDRDSLKELAWERIRLITVAYLDLLGMTDFMVCKDMFPVIEKYDPNDEERGDRVREQYERFYSKMSPKDKSFYRRFIANLIVTYCFDLVTDDARNNYLNENAAKVIISLTVPPLWKDEDLTDRMEFFSKLSMLQRMTKKAMISKLAGPIKEQMAPDLVDYAVMFAGLFGLE